MSYNHLAGCQLKPLDPSNPIRQDPGQATSRINQKDQADQYDQQYDRLRKGRVSR
ncbi:MAG: hypothetical protein N0E39_08990 [Candidatus Thiodiazotropha lotti]|nr:hypothetical protein [Candidatus Thiodiazotropha lotti]